LSERKRKREREREREITEKVRIFFFLPFFCSVFVEEWEDDIE
jgi:membrane-anchored protein YejM (alkaline phosphatase superfamily)